jgi:hypothetical protein
MRLPRRKRRDSPAPAEAPDTADAPDSGDAPDSTNDPSSAEAPDTAALPHTAEPVDDAAAPDTEEAAAAPEPPGAPEPPAALEPPGVEDDWVTGGAPRRHWAGIAATSLVLIAALAAVGLAQTSAGRTVLRRAGLAERARPYTELYFADPRHLPLEVIKQSPRQRVSFVIRNQEHRRQTYRWTIGTKGSPPEASGTVSLYVGHWATIARKVRVDCTGKRAYEQVSLPGQGETIGYWLSCRSLTPATKK